MGIQYVCAKHVNRSDVITTIITVTVSNLVSCIVSHSQSTSTDTKAIESLNFTERFRHKRWWRQSETSLFLMITQVGYFIGAASSDAALLFYIVMLLQYHLH